MTDDTNPSTDRALWEKRIGSYTRRRNALWEITQALTEMDALGKQYTDLRDMHSGLPNVEIDDLRAWVAAAPGQYPHLEEKLQENNATILNYKTKVYDTGYEGSCAFDNELQYAPISILVCPRHKPYLNFEHFAGEAEPEEVGKFMKSVNKVALDAVQAHDTAVSAKPEASQLRDYYEQQFDAIRNDPSRYSEDELTDLATRYVADSSKHRFALRDARTGHSGFRIAFNNGTATSGMSQAHTHAQILGGRFLGMLQSADPAKTYTRFKRLGASLAI